MSNYLKLTAKNRIANVLEKIFLMSPKTVASDGATSPSPQMIVVLKRWRSKCGSYIALYF
ncbi:MAG: hypothetical protein F6K40_24280 [Okeania sp. SIO3I5]|nr:hypothetical protein [Okeania sp. SIO3I5]